MQEFKLGQNTEVSVRHCTYSGGGVCIKFPIPLCGELNNSMQNSQCLHASAVTRKMCTPNLGILIHCGIERFQHIHKSCIMHRPCILYRNMFGGRENNNNDQTTHDFSSIEYYVSGFISSDATCRDKSELWLDVLNNERQVSEATKRKWLSLKPVFDSYLIPHHISRATHERNKFFFVLQL